VWALVSALGILGGSFNPPHLGHLALARAAASELALDRLLIVPVFLAPHRPAVADDAGADHRLAMCRELFGPHRGLEVSTLEVDRGGRSYTVDTLMSVHASDPDAELTVILGADVACTLPSWRSPREILSLSRLAVAQRGPVAAQTGALSSGAGVIEAVHSVDPHASVALLHMPTVAVSSTMVRERLAQGLAVDDLVGAAVADYIAANGLYRSAAPAVLS
jgi:nicotinate-nucleotide adenylyltransferase